MHMRCAYIYYPDIQVYIHAYELESGQDRTTNAPIMVTKYTLQGRNIHTQQWRLRR